MKTQPILLVLATLAVLLASNTSSAKEKGTWSHSLDFRYTGKAALKVVDPEGYKITVGESKKGAIPVVVQLENRSDYIVVAITAKDGSRWKKKVEIRRNYETVLSVNYTLAKKKKAPPTFVGTAKNTTHECFGNRDDLRFDFTLAGKVAAQLKLDARDKKSARIPAGNYSVRIYKRGFSDYEFLAAKPLMVGGDGWAIDYGCHEDGDDTPR